MEATVGVMSMLVLESITCTGVRKIGIVVDREGGGVRPQDGRRGYYVTKKET